MRHPPRFPGWADLLEDRADPALFGIRPTSDIDYDAWSAAYQPFIHDP